MRNRFNTSTLNSLVIMSGHEGTYSGHEYSTDAYPSSLHEDCKFCHPETTGVGSVEEPMSDSATSREPYSHGSSLLCTYN